jgi:hypothetical protein
MANANSKKEMVTNNFKEGEIEKAVQLNAIAVTKFDEALSQNAFVIFGFGSDGNALYKTLMQGG